MKTWKRNLLQWFAAIAVVAMSACGGGSDSVTTGGGSVAPPTPPPGTPAPGAGMGSLRVALTDAPSCGYDHVYITVERVRVHMSSTADDGDGGWSEVVVDPARRIDLLSLTNGVLAELGQTPLPAGLYKQVRLVLAPNGAGTPANAVVPTGGTEVPLKTPSAQQSGLKLIHEFTVAPNMMADLLLDFDACRSVVRAGNSGLILLKPVIAVIPRTTTAIVGVVDSTIAGVMVTAQKDGTVVRGTVPNSNGEFVLSGLDVAQSPFDVVITAPGRATAVIAAVPVTASATTPVSMTAAPIELAMSAMGVVNGKVTPVVAEGSVRALQAVGTVPKVEIAFDNADSTTGDYSLSLPIEAARLATYSAMLPLTFMPQPATDADYTLEAFATGYVTQTSPVTVGAMPVVKDFALVPAP